MRQFRYSWCIAVLLLVAVGVVQADDREWIKRHHLVEMDEIVLGEYTHISTSDELSPYKNRILYLDPQGVRLVLRATIDVVREDGQIVGIQAAEHSVTSLDTGEQLVMELQADRTQIATLGAASFTYTDQFQLPQQTKDDAQAFLHSNASQSFQTALHGLARVGLQYAPILMDVSASLEQLFFYDAGAGNPANYVTESDVVLDFDPQLTQPGPFEEQFGPAYYD